MKSLYAGVLVALLLLLTVGSHAAAAFLEQETLILDMTGSREVKTSRSLERHKEYRLTLKSPYDLLPIWGALMECRCVRYLLLIDGQSPSDKDRVSPWDSRHDIGEVTWRWWGNGSPISLRLAKNMTSDIRHATIEVSRVQAPLPPPLAPPPPPTPAPPPPPVIVPVEPTAARDVLARARFSLPVNGRAFKTDLPLESGRLFHLRIHSPHDLRRLWNTLRTQFRVQLDGLPLNHAALVTPWDLEQEILEVVFSYRGKNEPLVFQLTDDVSEAIPEATVEIIPAPKPAPEAPKAPSRLAGIIVVVLLVLCVLALILALIGWLANKGARRLRALQRQREAAEQERARKAEAERAALVAQAQRAEAAERARQAQEAARQQELEKRAVAWAQWAEFKRNFLDQEFQQNYARKHMREILEKWGDEWFEASKQVKNDKPLKRLLEETYPIVLLVLEARLETARIAAQIEAAPPPQPENRPKPTTDRVRGGKVQHLDMKAMDYMATSLRMAELEQAYAEELQARGIEGEEFETKMQEFRDKMTTVVEDQEEAHASKTPSDYKAV